MPTRLRLDDLLGRQVRDESGRALGRIFDARAEPDGDELVLVEFHVGTHALAARLGVSFLRLFGIDRSPEPTKIPWDELDLRDPDNPVRRSRASGNEDPDPE